MTDRPDPNTMKEYEKLLEIVANVRKILNPWGRKQWLKTPIPALDNRTPLEIMGTREDLTPLLLRTRSYLDDSFS